ncbi:hypothetical protein [Prescottella equi]|uniref:hypothetical protein n=1 Tax=Rhodococcus hoagii TaxID=43767 RepID=UPI000A1133AD|nr:hypothetical protein [Prescottella equi]ORL76405.1 hypothetical protein A5N71_16330 [Prescottella equi]
MTRQQFRTVNERVRARLAEIETEMAAAGAGDLIAPILTGGDVAAAWAGLTVARRRAVIDTLAEVTIHSVGRGVRTFRPESVEIAWRRG